MPRYILLHHTSSTNSYLSRMAAMLPEGTVIHTHHQSEGRGQRGNSWESEPGRNITFSMLLKRPNVPVAAQFAISEAVAVAIVDTLSSYADGFSIKWPNDIYHGDKKVAGILIEHSVMGASINHSIIGVGINVNQTVFVSDAPNPISLAQIIGHEIPLDTILHQVCEAIEQQCRFQSFTHDSFHSLHQRFLSLLYRRDGALHNFLLPNGHTFRASIADVEPCGLLVLQSPDGSLSKFAFKEVAFVI